MRCREAWSSSRRCGLGHGERAQELALVPDGLRQLGSGERGERVPGYGELPRLQVSLGRPGRGQAEVRPHPEPHFGPGRAAALRKHSGRPGQDVLQIERPGHALGELGQDLVGRGPLAVYQAVGESSGPDPDGLEGHGDQRGGQDRKEQVRLAPGADRGADPHHQAHVDGGDEGRQDAHDQGLADHHVQLVQPVLQDGDAARHRQGDAEPEHDNPVEQPLGKVVVEDVAHHHGHHGNHRGDPRVSEPPQLLAFVAPGSA